MNHRVFTDDNLAAAWCRWSPQLAILLAEVTTTVVDKAMLADGQRVLDLASGTGEPALALARAVAPAGEVIATDIAESMLRCARKRATGREVNNIRFAQVDASSLEVLNLADDSLDAVTCRFGVMYFADVIATLKCVHSLLKPAGRVVLVSWGSPEQPYFACTRGIVETRFDVPKNPDAPNTFAFAEPGSLERALQSAGFDQIADSSLTIQLHWPGSAHDLWRLMQELTASFQHVARQLRSEWAQITREVIAALQPYVHGDSIRMPAEINVAVAYKTES